MAARLLPILLVTWIGGCSYRPAYDGAYCSPAGVCPPGYHCDGEFCVRGPAVDGGDAGVSDDGGGSGDGDPASGDPGPGDAGSDSPVDAGDPVPADPGSDPGPGCDQDHDGYESLACGGQDCDDGDPAVHPGASEGSYGTPSCSDGKDNDCDGRTDGSDDGCEPPPEWWDVQWRWRRKITFRNLGREQLNDFPVLVRLDANRIEYDQTGPQGFDIRFVDAEDARLLPYEIENWDKSGNSFLWVKVPAIDANSDQDHIWMYYGKPDAVDGQTGRDVWSNSYQGVYHLGDLADSSPAGLHGDDRGTSAEPGFVHLGRGFNGTDGWIDLGQDVNFLRNVPACTVSAMVRAGDIGDADRCLISLSVHQDEPTSRSRAYLCLTDWHNVIVGGRSQDDDSEHAAWTDFDPVEAGVWYHLAGVLDYASDRITIYLDGLPIYETGADFPGSGTSDTPASSCAVGAQDDGSADYFHGQLDEIRVATVARTGGWLDAQHLSLSDQLLDFLDPPGMY